MIAIRLRTDQMENPLGLQNRRPLLSWNCEGGIVQTAYEAAAFSDGRQIWSSGRQESGKHGPSDRRRDWQTAGTT